MMKIFFTSKLLLILTINIFAQANDTSSGFANSLYQQQQYQFAALEYQRLLFFNASDTFARVQMLRAFNRSRQYRMGIDGFFKFNTNISLAYKDEAYQYGLSLLHTQRFDSLSVLILENRRLTDVQRLTFQSSQQLLQGQYFFAYALLSKNTTNNTTIVQLRDLSNEALNMRFKSQSLAAGLSAIVPGVGQCYSNQWREGLVTLVASLLSGYKVYSDIRDGRRTSGLIYGASFSLLYIYGIISASESAKNYNANFRKRFDRRTYEIVDGD